MTKKERIAQKNELINYAVSKGFKKVTLKRIDCVVLYKKNESGSFIAHSYVGASAKKRFNYRFSTFANLEHYVTNWEQNEFEKKESRDKRGAERKAKNAAFDANDHWMVGDVVYTSWGYEQTNINFYQVVKVTKKSLKLREIAQNSSDSQGQPGGGYCQPRRNEFLNDKVTTHRCTEDSCSTPYYSGSKWSGKALFTSSYH